MYLSSINNLTFESKKFRMIVESQMYTRVGTSLVNIRTTSKYVKEYSNPKAEEIYKKIQNTRDIYEKADLYEQMGDYELKDLSIKERLQCVLDKPLKDYLYRG